MKRARNSQPEGKSAKEVPRNLLERPTQKETHVHTGMDNTRTKVRDVIEKAMPLSSIEIGLEQYDASFVAQIEESLGKDIDSVSVADKTTFTVEIGGEVYRDNCQAFFSRLSRSLFGDIKVGKAKQYLCLRKEKGHKEALADVRAEAPSTIPTQHEIFTPSLVQQIQSALDMQVEEISTIDRTEFTVHVGKKSYTDTPAKLFTRIAVAFFKVGERGKAKRYLALRLQGEAHEKAVTTANKEFAEKKATAVPSLPISEEIFSKVTVKRIEDALGVADIGAVRTQSNTKFTIKIRGKEFQDTPEALFLRITHHWFTSARQPGKGRTYLALRKKGLSHSDAIKNVQLDSEKEAEDALNPIPTNPDNFTPQVIQQIEEALACNIEGVSSESKARFTIALHQQQHRDAVAALLMRITREFFPDSGTRGVAKNYLILRKSGVGHAEAVQGAPANGEYVMDKEFEELSKLKLEEAVALLQHDPLKLKLYIQFAHPEMSEEDFDRLVIRSFKGLVTGTNETKERQYLGWKQRLADLNVKTKMPKSTQDKTVLLTGKAPGAESVYISGSWNRRVRVEPDGQFIVCIPLKIGQENEIRVMGLNRENKVRSAQQEFVINQEGDTDDVAALIALLSDLRTDLLAGIQRDPGRTKFFVACAEKVLIKKFGRSFEDGKGYVQRLIASTESPLIKKVLAGVLKNFETINKMKLPNVREGSLMFFQKYCAYAIRHRMAEGASGVILANDPGLGKTRTVLAALSDEEAAVFTPNSVVSAWDEEAGEVMENPELLVMRDIPHETRKQLLRNGEHLRLVTNVQFLQKTKDAERFALLSNEDTVVVHDEAHSRANEQSEQSRGARMLKHKFQINVSATPFKNPKTFRRILAILEPNDSRFQSDAAFEEAFPAHDPQALKALSLLKDKYTIRFRKQDVMEEVDPTVLLSQQPHKLPKKEYVLPDILGQFEMSEEQAEATYELFLNWPQWCRKYDKYMPDDEVAEEDHLRSAGALTKRHALRQTINNPSYIGSDAEDAKAWQTQRIVRKCIKEGRKVVIFCGYNAQALKYAEMFKQYNPALYVGLTSEQGDKKDINEQPMKFARDQAGKKSKRGWVFDPHGYPKEDPAGETMSALDYERLTFQNAPDRQLIIATYQAGAVGTTFTAGKAMIFDDLPADVIEAIQAEDRIHRIDPHRQTHASVQYYSMQSRYPKRFLERMKKVWVVKQEDGTYEEYRSRSAAQTAAEALETEAQTAYDTFFAQGTYDQVQFGNLKTQKQMFHLINDGIADETILNEAETSTAI